MQRRKTLPTSKTFYEFTFQKYYLIERFMCDVKRLYQVTQYSLFLKFGSSSLSVSIKMRDLWDSGVTSRNFTNYIIRHFTVFIKLIRQLKWAESNWSSVATKPPNSHFYKLTRTIQLVLPHHA